MAKAGLALLECHSTAATPLRLLELPAPEAAKPQQGDVIVVREWLNDLRVYPDRYVVGFWRDNSPNIRLGNWLVNWEALKALTFAEPGKKPLVVVIRKVRS